MSITRRPPARDVRVVRRSLRATLVTPLLLLALVAGPPRVSQAADSPDPPLVGHDGAGVARSEAEKHFRRGIELYDDADLAGATAELERAYQLVPSYKILYNLGQISYQRQDYVQALAHFRHYLRDGGGDLPGGRREKVEQDIQQLERRIGRIEIATDTTDDGADILLDDVKVASAPVAGPLSASVGQRKLELVRPAGPRSVRMVEVIGGETARIRFARPVPGLSGNGLSALAGSADPGTTSSRAAGWFTTTGRPPHGGAEPARSVGPAIWVTWSATALLAAGAAISGGMALAASRDLQQRRDGYPLAPGDLDAPSSRARRLALVTDGFLAGTLLMAAASLYVTLDPTGQAEAPGRTGPW